MKHKQPADSALRTYKRIAKIIGLDRKLSELRNFEAVGFVSGKLVHFKSIPTATVREISLRDSIRMVGALQREWEGSHNGMDCDSTNGALGRWLRTIAAALPS